VLIADDWAFMKPCHKNIFDKMFDIITRDSASLLHSYLKAGGSVPCEFIQECLGIRDHEAAVEELRSRGNVICRGNTGEYYLLVSQEAVYEEN
jgi:hypothetical protein